MPEMPEERRRSLLAAVENGTVTWEIGGDYFIDGYTYPGLSAELGGLHDAGLIERGDGREGDEVPMRLARTATP